MADALRTWAAELDRSFAQIAELAADARTFDRLRLNRIADSWDNSIHSFVRAACTRRPWMRQAIARDGTAYRTWRSHPAELQLLTPQTTGDLVAGFEVYPEPPTATLVYASPGKSWGLRRVAVRNPARFVVDRGAFDAPRAEAPVRLEP